MFKTTHSLGKCCNLCVCGFEKPIMSEQGKLSYGSALVGLHGCVLVGRCGYVLAGQCGYVLAGQCGCVLVGRHGCVLVDRSGCVLVVIQCVYMHS